MLNSFLKSLFLFLILSLIALSSKGQDQFILDSLQHVVRNAKADSSKVNALNKLAYEYRTNNPDTSLYFASAAKILSTKINFKFGLADACLWSGYALNNLGNYDAALQLLQQSLYLYDSFMLTANAREKNKFLVGKTIAQTNIGAIYYLKGNYPEALKNHLLALKFSEEINFKKGIAISNSNIAMINQEQGNYEAALRSNLYALKIMKELGDKKGIASSYTNIGAIYHAQNNQVEALKNYFNGLKIKQEINDKQGIAISYNNIGNLYLETGNNDSALKNLLACLKISEELENKSGMAISCNNIGNIYFKLKNAEKAYFYYNKGLKLAQELQSIDDLKQSYGSLATLDSAQKKYDQALQHYKLFICYRDSLFNEENTKILVQTQMQFDFDKKESLARVEQEKKDALTKKEMEAQKFVRNTFIGGFILVVLIALFIFQSLQQNRKAKAIITLQKTEVEAKNKEILDSIEYAKRLQNAILPESKLVKEYLIDSFIYYKPKDIVAGDFYWFYPTTNSNSERIILFAAADCTGHGVPGAMVSVVCANALNKAVKELNLKEPGKILDAVSEFVTDTFVKKESTHEDDVKDGMDISLCALNLNTLHLQWSGANNPLLIIRKSSVHLQNKSVYELEEFKPDKQPIGLFSDRKAFTTHHLQLKKGELLYLFTDGYADQFGGKEGKKLLKKNLKEYFLKLAQLPLDVQLTELAFHFESWKGSNLQVDDVCVIGVRV